MTDFDKQSIEENPDPDRIWGLGLDWLTPIIPIKLSEAESILLLEHLDATLRGYNEDEHSAIRSALERIRERLVGIIDPGRGPIVHTPAFKPTKPPEELPTETDEPRSDPRTEQEHQASDSSHGQESSGN